MKKKILPPKRKSVKRAQAVVVRKPKTSGRIRAASARPAELPARANNTEAAPAAQSSPVQSRIDKTPAPCLGSSGQATFNNVFTASRINCALRCLRQHFWQFEIGLRKDKISIALRFGSAWARGMEARWNGATFEEALAAAIPVGVELDEYACATISALLAAYFDYYGEQEVGRLLPEVQFKHNLPELGEGFTVQGVIDGVGELGDGLPVIVESKTTSDSIDPDSNFWLRLNFNVQVFQYVLAAREEGYDIAKVFYDVTRKPSIRPKVIDEVDGDGLKIVLDGQGNRVIIQKGKNAGQPRQSGDKEKGYVVQSHIETPDEFSDRLYRDALKRPDFYFVRREVTILDQDLESFQRQRFAVAKMVLGLRANEEIKLHVPNRKDGEFDASLARDPEAWPRNVSENTCDFCSYKTFCLQNISIDVKQPPEGFTVKPFNPELNNHDTAQTDYGSAGENASSASA